MQGELKKCSIDELYSEILCRLGYCGNLNNSYQKLEGQDLVTYSDSSYHGSSSFKETKRITLTETEKIVLSALLDIKNEIKNVSDDKEAKKIEAEIEFLKIKLENYRR